MLPISRGRALYKALFCILVTVHLCGAAASSAGGPAAHDRPPATTDIRSSEADAVVNSLLWMLDQQERQKHESVLRPGGLTPLADVDNAEPPVRGAAEVTGSESVTKSSGAVPMTITTTTTTSSRFPSPASTPAPKVAQWVGISVAIVALAGLIAGLVLCKLKTKEKCWFAPKPREMVVISPGGSTGFGSKSPSEDSFGLHEGERAFHEAALDENAPRRSLVDINAANGSRNGDEDDSSDDDDEVYVENGERNGHLGGDAALRTVPPKGATGQNPAMTFSPTVPPALPPIGHFHPRQSQSKQQPSTPQRRLSGMSKQRLPRSSSVSFSN
ncbi:hypothetical protein ABB37_09789 [Leptomonas pyrrhocoris]|uniref:Transmembrane protein n=1 Tax=Leptomonas pyrrhocoris TaxID=157538 RepID=A0A0N0DQP0_LEPPY|nr:hypothetical protein ABB37_09789 [Leptomonas pyrrhocoris]XP_015651901.1 hypothetical protein ABB37_09789 [Leptomonas pyrrhocoris]KPA73461.1 hypothetical protein ABB37_09789 [Leptomonas pyrrhocoris]KPA73462.1 hypothetical protein ABB37_09789 [Leptomonas pyrrhocoris]|eukprot:XP_015651900.1 hypothetical protein ABB37_09789 [Leptomonas pyrrhocoris]